MTHCAWRSKDVGSRRPDDDRSSRSRLSQHHRHFRCLNDRLWRLCGVHFTVAYSLVYIDTTRYNMKIVIIGAGISGLGTAIALRKYLQPQLGNDLEIKVYDEARIRPVGEIHYSWHDHSDIRQTKKKNRGAAISLQANAFKVLRDLDPDLAERVHATGLPCRGFTWKSASDWSLGHEDLAAHLISRPVLIECLMGALPEGVVEYRTVKNVVVEEGKKPTICFADGGEESADLVVGADGIRSPLRKALFGEGEEYRPKYL